MSDRAPLTRKQQEILDFMKAEVIAKGYPPSVREICTAVNLSSTSSVHAQLGSIEKKGYIRRDPTKPRAIEILDDAVYAARANEPEVVTTTPLFQETVNVPVIGNVAAGEPIFAEQNITDYFSLNSEFLPSGSNVFMLKVKGESMINVGIYNGDLLLVSEQNYARNGEIVVALVEDSATVKTFYKENGHIRLQPENDTMDPIIVPDCQILGKVTGLYRRF
ncbi:MAG: transcriptional repressor LexA [Lachnospiraceae bacterium]|nr:transcriptional repressor LexA [Lachnospiraceae bacterium]